MLCECVGVVCVCVCVCVCVKREGISEELSLSCCRGDEIDESGWCLLL